MKIRLLGAEMFHAGGWTDGRTDMRKLIVAFRIFAKAPKMSETVMKSHSKCSSNTNRPIPCDPLNIVAYIRQTGVLIYRLFTNEWCSFKS